jgi:hypothetical protein
VQVLRLTYPNGAATVQIAGTRPTDDRGNFRLYGLMPGEYFVAVTPIQALGARGGRGGGALVAALGVAPAAPASPSNPQPAPVKTYFPNVTSLSQAAQLHVHAGEEVSNINLNFQIGTGGRISGDVVSSIPVSEMMWPAQIARGGIPDPPNVTLTLNLHDKNALQDPNANAGSNTTISLGNPANGHFEIPNILPGVYDLYASVPDINGYGPQQPPGHAVQPVAYGRATIDIHGGNQDGVAITVHHGIDVTGRVTIDGGASPSINNVRISLQADDSASKISVYQQIGRFLPMIDPDGSFTIPAVSEAHYRIQVLFGPPPPSAAAQPTLLSTLLADAGARGGGGGGRGALTGDTPAVVTAVPPVASTPLAVVPLSGPPLNPNAYVADIRQSGMSIYDDGLGIGFQNIQPLEILVKTDGGAVEGTVHDSNQKPVAGATVVLLPPMQHRQNPALFKTATSDASGHFSLIGIRPDEYKLLAWDSILPGAYMNSDFIKQYEDKETSVNVPASIHLDAQIAVISVQR